jgi:hypothetical protein
MAAINLEDDGFIYVKIDGVEQRLDLFQLNNEIFAIMEKYKTASEQNAAIAELVQAKGFPPVSHKLACNLANAVQNAMESLKKKPDGTP